VAIDSRRVLEVWASGISAVIDATLEGAEADREPDRALVLEHWSATMETLLELSSGRMLAEAAWRACSMEERVAMMQQSEFSFEMFCNEVKDVVACGLARAEEPIRH